MTQMVARAPRILLLDIETTMNIVNTFDVFKANISYKKLRREWYVVCAAWKWLGEKKVHAVSVLDDAKSFKKDHTNDYHVIQALFEAINQADAVVAHNGDKFDMRKINARAIFHRIAPHTKPVQIDTLKIARREFAFTWNRLDYLGSFLGVGNKIKTDEDLWLQAQEGDEKAIRKMVKYNKQDVNLLEDVYEILKPYAGIQINRNLFDGNGCPSCGSTDFAKNGHRYTATRIYQRYCCNSCGRSFRDARCVPNTAAAYR